MRAIFFFLLRHQIHSALRAPPRCCFVNGWMHRAGITNLSFCFWACLMMVKTHRLLIFVINTKRSVKPAPSSETFYERDPSDDRNDDGEPRSFELRRPRPQPPKREQKTENPI